MTIKAEYNPKIVKLWIGNHEKLFKKMAESKRKDYGVLLSSIVFADIMEHFSSEQGPEGKWKPWSQTYIDILSRRKGPVPENILQDTGNLRQGVQIGNTRKANNRSFRGGYIYFNAAQTKSGFPYAAAHDKGGGRLPARPYMWLSDKGMDKIEKQTISFIKRKA